MSEPKRYTAEVEEALRAYKPTITTTEQIRPPPGHTKYHLVVGQTVLAGTAPTATVAAMLRELAQQIEPSEGAEHG